MGGGRERPIFTNGCVCWGGGGQDYSRCFIDHPGQGGRYMWAFSRLPASPAVALASWGEVSQKKLLAETGFIAEDAWQAKDATHKRCPATLASQSQGLYYTPRCHMTNAGGVPTVPESA